MLAATFLQCLVTFGMLFQVKMIFNPKESAIKSILKGISQNFESDFCVCFSSGQSTLDLIMALH